MEAPASRRLDLAASRRRLTVRTRSLIQSGYLHENRSLPSEARTNRDKLHLTRPPSLAMPVQITGKTRSTPSPRLHGRSGVPFKNALSRSHIPGMRASIRKGLVTPVKECLESLDWSARGGSCSPRRLRKTQRSSPAPDSNPSRGFPRDPPHRSLPVSPSVRELVGDLAGAFSRRINIHHRLVYQVLRRERIVKVIRIWTNSE